MPLKPSVKKFAHKYVILLVIGTTIAILVFVVTGEPLGTSRIVEMLLSYAGETAVDIAEE